MKEVENKLILEFCKNFITWIKNESIFQHNVYLDKRNPFNSGKSMAYYQVYHTLQQQAEAFLIPLEILDFNDLYEKDFLSMKKIILPERKFIECIPLEYQQSTISWIKDYMWVINTEIECVYCNNKLDAYDQGQRNASEEILSYMEKKQRT